MGIPTQAASPFLGRLRRDERLLWEGRPVPEAYARHHVNPYLLAGVGVVTCFLVAWELLSLVPLMARFGYEAGLLLLTGLLFGVSYSKVTHLLSIGLRNRAKETDYALTNRRIMVAVSGATDQSRNYDELHLSDLQLSLRELPLGVGSISFGVSPFHFSLAFRGIEDARHVSELIEEAKRRQIEAESLRPASYARPDVWDKYREEGEALLWRGEPSALQALIFFVMGGGFAALLADVVWTDGPRFLAAPFSQAALKSLATWLWSAFLVGLFWAGAGEARNTFYALTDRRLLRLYRVGKCPRFMEMTLDKAHFLTLEWQMLRLGTITFGTKYAREFYFRTLWDAPAVFRVIQQARPAKRAQTRPRKENL